MSNPLFLAGCLEQATYTMSLTEDAAYPLANLSTYIVSDLWKSPASTNDQTLNIDIGAAIAIDSIVVDGHNFAGMTNVQLEVDAADNPAFPNPVGIIPVNNPFTTSPIVFSNAVPPTKRYWRLRFVNTNSIIPQLGQIFITKKFDPGFTQSYPYNAKNEEFSTSRRRAIDGMARNAQVYAGVLTYQLTFDAMPATFEANWLRFHQKVRGALCPFYFIDTDSTMFYMMLDQDVNDIETFRYNLCKIGSIKIVSQGVNQNPLS
jgi:hypothetical protein